MLIQLTSSHHYLVDRLPSRNHPPDHFLFLKDFYERAKSVKLLPPAGIHSRRIVSYCDFSGCQVASSPRYFALEKTFCRYGCVFASRVYFLSATLSGDCCGRSLNWS